MAHCIAVQVENVALEDHHSDSQRPPMARAAIAQRDTGMATGPSWYTLTSGVVAITLVTLFSIETPTRFVFTITNLF